MTKTIRLLEWFVPGDTAIPGMSSLKDGDLQHSSALAQSPIYWRYRAQPSRQKLIRNGETGQPVVQEATVTFGGTAIPGIDQYQKETMIASLPRSLA